MKTIYTSLPIYDNIAKQCYERIKKSSLDKLVPVTCPRHRLPSFQWNAETDDMGDVTMIEMLNKDYNGSTTMAAADWATNFGYDTFDHVGLEISSAINAAGLCYATSETFGPVIRGSQVRLVCTLTLNSAPGTEPTVFLQGMSTIQILEVGVNDLILTAVSTAASIYVLLYLDGATDFSLTDVSITLLEDALNITDFFPALPAETVLTADTYYTYDGDTLNWLLPPGEYYLRITMEEGYVLYSEWFEVTCVYKNLITEITNVSYDAVFTASGTSIINAQELGVDGRAQSDTFSVIKDEVITVICYLTLTSGQLPYIKILAGVLDTISNQDQLAAGLNTITLTATETRDDAYIYIFNTDESQFSTSEIQVQRAYSEKYLTVNYSNTCDLGDILYSEGLTQTVWFESETMEPSFPQEEQGVNNGEERFVRSFARQTKKYLARTKDMPDFMAEVFHRMKLHDSIEMIDLIGNENTVYNLEVDHEWLFEDKYLVRIDLTFDYDEVFVIAGCCNNLT